MAYQQVVLKAWHEVDDAIGAYVAETQRGAQLALRARDADAEAALAKARHSDGLTSYLPVLSAAVTTLDAQRELVDSQARLRTALVALYKSLGDDSAQAATAR